MQGCSAPSRRGGANQTRTLSNIHFSDQRPERQNLCVAADSGGNRSACITGIATFVRISSPGQAPIATSDAPTTAGTTGPGHRVEKHSQPCPAGDAQKSETSTSPERLHRKGHIHLLRKRRQAQ